jgi:ABC-type nitrate/sulfonate/bicarbonate transport system permease component
VVVVRVLPFGVLLVVWWLASGNPFVTPPPDVVWRRALEDGFALHQTLVTFARVLIAFALAGLAGVTLGTLIGCVGFVRRALQPLLAFLFPVPKIALYPAMLIILGLGSASKIGLGFAEAVFPILLATAAATARVEPALVWSARALGTRHTLARVVVPAASSSPR